MDRNIEELEKKVKFLQVTIDKIKKWIWLKYEDQIPQEILECDLNIDDNLVTTTNTCQLGDKFGHIDIKEEINEEIILPDLSDDNDEMDHFFGPNPSRGQIDSQIVIDEKILPFYDPPSSPLENHPQNRVPNLNIIGRKHCVIKLKRLDDISIQRSKVSISSRAVQKIIKDKSQEKCEYPNEDSKHRTQRKRTRRRLNGSHGADIVTMKGCKICGIKMRKGSLVRHMLLHNSDKWQHTCQVDGCIKRFPVRNALMDHYRIHMNPHRDEYSDEFTKNCPEDILKFIENRKISMSKWWRNKGVEQYRVKLSKGEISQALKEACTVCGKALTRKHLKKHMLIHTGTLKLRFPCTVENCPRKFPTKNQLNSHAIIHTDPTSKIYSEGYAKKCPQEVLKYLDKRKKKKIRRENAKIVDCPTCGVSMFELYLSSHIKSKHKNQKGEKWNYACQVSDCNLKFPLKTALWEHYGVHLNPRNGIYSPEFKKKCPAVVLKFIEKKKKNNAKKTCSVCGKEVITMARHKRLVHDTENKRFSCEICTWKFHLKDNLWAHYSVHVNPRSKSYSEEFAKKCPQEILQHIKKRKICNKKYNRASASRIRISKKEKEQTNI